MNNTSSSLPKIVLAPMNVASMPFQIVRGLKERGYHAEQVQYSFGEGHKFGYELDREVNIRNYGGRIKAHSATLRDYLERDFDIFHFWNKSLFYEGQYGHLTGFDIPLIKTRGKRIAYRFTGFDLRLPSWDMAVNPHSPFRYGYRHPFDEDIQKRYLDFLSEHVDQFLVQDPELHQFAPRPATIIPRALKLDEWENTGIHKTERPLVVHAPSNDAAKGSKFVLAAVETLKDEGLNFNFKAIRDMAHQEAVSWYKRADIIIDQLLIGATGVLTLEAWALGKPCVVYLREDLFESFYGTRDLPVANANPDTITDTLRNLIKDFEWREELSFKGRATVERFHDIDSVIEQYIELYGSMMEKEPSRPTGVRDIGYLELQAQLSQRPNLVANHKGGDGHAGNNVPLSASPPDFFRSLDGDEKLDILDTILPRPLVWPIRKYVEGRRRIVRSGKALKKSSGKIGRKFGL